MSTSLLTTEPVALTVTGGLAHIQLTRPDSGNAIGLATAIALLRAAQECQAQRVRAIVLSAVGKNFCVGGDLREFAGVPQGDLADHLAAVTGNLHAAQGILADLDAPIVIAVHGAVAGAGLGLAVGGDLVLAADDTRFVSAYTGIGFTPDAGTTWALTRAVGRIRALDLMLSNRVLTAAEAVSWGLASREVPRAALTEQALSLGAQLTAGPTMAFGQIKKMVSTAPSTTRARRSVEEAAALVTAATSPEGREGVAAFVGKRPPRFQPDQNSQSELIPQKPGAH